MKKLLLVSILLGLILLIFSLNNTSGERASRDENITPMIKTAIIDIYTHDNDELSSKRVEIVENNESNFSVSIGSDRNTTRDTNESFIVEVNNADNIESCNYFWKITNDIEDEESLFGREIEFAFPKGESSVMVNVICGEQEANATIKVTAWEYYERKTYHYNAYYGELEYTEREIFDYRGNYLIVDNGTFSKANFVYDDKGRLIERKRVYYQYPAENSVTKFTYNSKGERVVVERLSLDGKLLYISLFTYNEEGDIISIQSGVDREHLEEEYSFTETGKGGIIYEVAEEYTQNNLNDQRVENEDGKVTYESYDDGYMKTTYEYSYHENGQVKKESYEAISEDEVTRAVRYYNDKGELLSRERSDKLLSNGRECSFRTDYTYNSRGYKASSVDVLLGGECAYLDEIEKRFTYDSEGNVVNVYSVLDGDVKHGHITTKVVKFYTNELEEF